MYFTSGSDRAFEQLMQTRPGADHFDSGEAGAPEDCGTCRFYRPHWKYQFCVYEECPYEDLQADGLSVDRKNYQLVYTAPLDKDTTLDEIYRRFNIEHPADYKGHSLSTGDIVVFRQDGKQTAYYVDEGADYRQVPEFFAQPEKQLTPDEGMTGEQIQTPRGRFYLTDRSREQMEAAGYGFHHQSEDGRYLIMANGTRAFAIPAQQESHIKTAEMSTE